MSASLSNRFVKALLDVDSPIARTEIYLRLLYSDEWARLAKERLAAHLPLPTATRDLLAQIDWQGLCVERLSRRRNLFAQLLRRCDPLMSVFREERLRALLDSFVNSPAFWSPTGRTLLENFTYAAHEEVRAAGHDFEADMLVMVGMISGVHSGSPIPSPWKTLRTWSGPIEMPGMEVAESITTQWLLLDADGSLPTASTLAATRIPADRRIIVARLRDGDVTVFSMDL